MTLVLQIPRHVLLARKGKDDTIIVELVRYNWLRMVSVSLQGGGHVLDAVPCFRFEGHPVILVLHKLPSGN